MIIKLFTLRVSATTSIFATPSYRQWLYLVGLSDCQRVVYKWTTVVCNDATRRTPLQGKVKELVDQGLRGKATKTIKEEFFYFYKKVGI